MQQLSPPRHRMRTLLTGASALLVISCTAVDTRSAEQVASGRELVGQVAQAVARLPAAAREIIWLGRFEFDSYEELALALGCNPGAARVRMHRAMQLLAAEIGAPAGDLTHA